MHGPNRWLILLAAGLCAAATVRGADAQDEPRSASRFDLAAYGGWSWTTDWVEVRDVGFGIGDNPIVGAFAAYYPTSRFGLRLHGAYIPSRYPTSENDALNAQLPIPDGRALNVWLYDLDLVYRPWARREGSLQSAYVFIGGGGLTTNPAGGNGECLAPYNSANACLSSEATTVGQGTVGAGVTFLRLTRALGIFAEGAVHFYDSPFSIGADGFVPNPECPLECLADDRMALTPRLVGGLALAMGRRPLPPPVALIAPPPVVAPPVMQPLRVCVQQEGFPQWVDAQFVPETGDTVVVEANGVRRPLRSIAPDRGTSATSRTWYVRDETIFYAGREYVKFGLPEARRPETFVRSGDYDGVPLFTRRSGNTAPGAGSAPAELLFPVYPDCTFQSYIPREIPVRG